jgi:hypothetical protein
MKPLLSILIPTLPFRSQYLNRLLNELQNQIINNKLNEEIEILVFLDEFENTLGQKRNILCKKSRGKYILYCDDDDMVSSDFCLSIIEILRHNSPDHICFKQKEINECGVTKSISEFSNKFSNSFKIIWDFNICDSKFCNSYGIFSLRYNNLILYKFQKNIFDILFLKLITVIFKTPKYQTYTSKTIPLKREIAIKYKFSDNPKNQDMEWVYELFEKKEIKTELHINKFLKFYNINREMSVNRGTSEELSVIDRKKMLEHYEFKTQSLPNKKHEIKNINIIYI